MTHWDDALGDEIKAAERIETERAAARGEAVVVRVDGAGFSKFTAKVARPFDARIHEAMVSATSAVVEAFNCKLGYTQSDEATFVIFNGESDLPHAGRLQKLASRFASKFGSHFLLAGLELFPEAIDRQVPDFDGRALPCDPEFAAKVVMWREIDARKNAVSMAARALFSHSSLHGKSSRTMKEMMAAEGHDYHDHPLEFRRGTFVRRVLEMRMLSDEEMERIPVARRPTEPVTRSRVARVEYPPLTLVQNLRDVVFDNALPEVPERPGFAAAVTP